MILLAKTSSPIPDINNLWENRNDLERNFTKVIEAGLPRKEKQCFYSSLLKELHISESYADIYKFLFIYFIIITIIIINYYFTYFIF